MALVITDRDDAADDEDLEDDLDVFLADPNADKPRILCEQAHPAHRLRVEHNRDALHVHLSDEDGKGWTVMAVGRATRSWVIAQSRRQRDGAEDADSRLYAEA